MIIIFILINWMRNDICLERNQFDNINLNQYKSESFQSLAVSKTNSNNSDCKKEKIIKKDIFYTKIKPKKAQQFNNMNILKKNPESIELNEERINIEIDENKPFFVGDDNQQISKKKDNSNSTSVKSVKKINIFINNKREREIEKKEKNNNKERNREKEYNCRLKIGRNFFNNFLIFAIINELLRQNGSNLCFEKFPQKFIIEAIKKKNNRYLEKNLKELLTEGESHKEEDKKEVGNFMLNCNALNKLEKNEDNNNFLEKCGLNKYLIKNYMELYEEYLKSEVYKEIKMELKGQKLEEFEKFSKYDNFIRYPKGSG